MPHNPADLPDYTHPDYDRLQPALKLLLDTYEGLYQRKDKYLPKAQMENDRAYNKRVEAAVFNNKLQPIINSNAGLLTAFDVSGLPSTLDEAQSNVDNHGSDLKSFVLKGNQHGLRDGVCYVFTMMEPTPEGERTRADDIENPRRPYWRLIDRRNVLNWRVTYENGEPVIQQVTLLMHKDVEDGEFGLKSEPRYHVLKRTEFGTVEHTVYAIEKKGRQREAVIVEGPTDHLISRIPLAPYFDATKPFPTDVPQFHKIAALNIKLFRQESALDSIQYFANCPTPWRRSRLPIEPTEAEESRPPFVLGERFVIELMAGDGTYGDDEVGILEVEGGSIEALQKGVNETKADIEAESLGFISGSRVERTATEAYLSGAQMAASLNGTARQMTAALKRMVEDWCMFTGEDASDFAVEMDASLLEMPLDAQEMQQLLGLWQAGAIDHQTLLELLRMGRQLPPSADIQEIIRRVKVEEAEQGTARDNDPELPLPVPAP